LLQDAAWLHNFLAVLARIEFPLLRPLPTFGG